MQNQLLILSLGYELHM